MISNNHLKICTKCHTEKPLNMFYICKTNKDGYRGSCKKCDYQRAVEWKENNPEKVKANGIKYWRKHKETLKKSGKNWREKNKEKIKERIRTPKSRYDILKSRAKQKELVFGISFETYIQLISEKCFYDNEPLNQTGCGLDRIDSNKGYTLDNVVPCCAKCNQAKNDRTQEEFIKHCLAVVQNAKLKKLTQEKST